MWFPHLWVQGPPVPPIPLQLTCEDWKEAELGNYHSEIQRRAQEVRRERDRHYISFPEEQSFNYTERERYFLTAAEYKIKRLQLTSKDKSKILDDAIDAYNFIALFFNEFSRRYLNADMVEPPRE